MMSTLAVVRMVYVHIIRNPLPSSLYLVLNLGICLLVQQRFDAEDILKEDSQVQRAPATLNACQCMPRRQYTGVVSGEGVHNGGDQKLIAMHTKERG